MAAASDPEAVQPLAGLRVPHIEGLRAIAALSVLVFHAVEGWYGEAVWDWPWLPAARIGPFGVALFFGISGFVLYRPWVARRVRGQAPPRVGRYALRRFARIFPAYWLALVLLTIFPGLPQVRDNPLPYLTLTQVYSDDWARGGLGTAWSLCVELTFYVMLPLYAWFLVRGRVKSVNREIALLLTLAPASTLIRGIATEIAPAGQLGLTIVATFVWFVPGMVLAIVVEDPRVQAGGVTGAIRGLAARRGAVPAVALASFAGLLTLPVHPDVPRHVPDVVAEAVLFATGTFALLLLALAPRAPRALASRPAVGLGMISYGIYLWHFPLVTLLAPSSTLRSLPLAFLAYLGALLIMTLIPAFLSYRFVERPLMEAVGSGRFRLLPRA